MKIYSGRKTGHCATGAERDGGMRLHAVKSVDGRKPADLWKPALCGTQPGRRGNGWDFREGDITCPGCLKKMKRQPGYEVEAPNPFSDCDGDLASHYENVDSDIGNK